MILRRWEELPEYMKAPKVKLYYEKLKKHQISLIIKRLFDFIVSLVMLVILWPFLMIIGLIIRLDSPGSALFRQERVTTYGKRSRFGSFERWTEGLIKKVRQSRSKEMTELLRSGSF